MCKKISLSTKIHPKSKREKNKYREKDEKLKLKKKLIEKNQNIHMKKETNTLYRTTSTYTIITHNENYTIDKNTKIHTTTCTDIYSNNTRNYENKLQHVQSTPYKEKKSSYILSRTKKIAQLP